MATKAEIVEFLTADFPQNKCIVVEVGNASATVTHQVGVDELRPGGTVSASVLMAVADVALYVAILGEVGIKPLTVTTSLTINFLRKPSPHANIVGVRKLIKVGKSLAVGDVTLYSDLALVSASCAIPCKVCCRADSQRQALLCGPTHRRAIHNRPNSFIDSAFV